MENDGERDRQTERELDREKRDREKRDREKRKKFRVTKEGGGRGGLFFLRKTSKPLSFIRMRRFAPKWKNSELSQNKNKRCLERNREKQEDTQLTNNQLVVC